MITSGISLKVKLSNTKIQIRMKLKEIGSSNKKTLKY